MKTNILNLDKYEVIDLCILEKQNISGGNEYIQHAVRIIGFLFTAYAKSHEYIPHTPSD